jgi:HTH-type transcriptional regulator/antitoxin HigA
MINYRTLDHLEEEYFRKHPEEIGPYLTEIFEEFALDGDAAALLASLRVIARVKGISVIARKTGMTRQGVQKALSSRGTPRLDNVNAIMQALGYRLTPQRVDITSYGGLVSDNDAVVHHP